MIKRHSVALVLAVVIGCITIGPYFYFATMPAYKGVALLGQDSEEYYVARIHEAYDGHPLSGNAYLPFKNVPYMAPALGEDVVALLGKLLFLTAAQVNVLSKFIFPLIAFLLAYALVLAMGGSRTVGALGAALAILGTELMSYPSIFIDFLRGRSLEDGIYWARPINPEVSGILLFGILFLMYRSFVQKRESRWWDDALIGVLIGASLYVSLYIWLFLGALLAILLAYYLWQRNFQLAKHLFITGILGALCAIPFAINHLHAAAQPGYPIAALQFGMFASHAPVLGIWVFALFLIPFFLSAQLANVRLFFIASAVALGLLLNQQIISGMYLQPGHFHWYITKPLVGLLLGIGIISVADRLRVPKYIRTIGAALIIGMLLIISALAQINFYKLNAPVAMAAQSYAPVFSYLNQDSKHEAVFADDALSTYIPLYTPADAPNAAAAGLFISPPHYFEERLFLEYKLRGVSPANALATMQTERATILSKIYGIYWGSQAPSDALQSLATAYAAAYREPIPAMMQTLGATLLIRDRALDQWTVPPSPALQQTALIDNRFEVYALSKQK